MSRSMLPRPLLIGLGAMIGVTLLGVASARLVGYKPKHEYAAAITSRQLRFADQDDGGIRVTDGATGETVGVVAPGGDGFLRATMRGLATERKHRGAGPEQPFLLSARADGALTLQDPATGRSLELEAFGPTNAAAFARFLPTPPAKTAAL